MLRCWQCVSELDGTLTLRERHRRLLSVHSTVSALLPTGFGNSLVKHHGAKLIGSTTGGRQQEAAKSQKDLGNVSSGTPGYHLSAFEPIYRSFITVILVSSCLEGHFVLWGGGRYNRTNTIKLWKQKRGTQPWRICEVSLTTGSIELWNDIVIKWRI